MARVLQILSTCGVRIYNWHEIYIWIYEELVLKLMNLFFSAHFSENLLKEIRIAPYFCEKNISLKLNKYES